MEGCLSVRGYYGDVARPEKITLEYFDESGKKHIRGASGLFDPLQSDSDDQHVGLSEFNRGKESHNRRIHKTGCRESSRHFLDGVFIVDNT